MVVLIIPLGIIYLLWIMIMGVFHISENKYKIDYSYFDNNFDKTCKYFKLPYYITKRGDHIYTAWYVFILPFIIISIGPFKFIYDSIANPIKKRQYENKNFISITDIYSFEKNDIIKLKNDDKIRICEFSLTGFSDESKNIYSWNQALENMTAKNRKINTDKNIKFEMFAKEAADFKTKADEFKKTNGKTRTTIDSTI